MSNPHLVATKGWLEYSAEQNPDNDGRALHAAALAQTEATLAVAQLTEAHVHATLALAYEQKTANLISFLEHAEGDTYQDNWQQIATRLGLGDTK